jgi:hypothetical protein
MPRNLLRRPIEKVPREGLVGGNDVELHVRLIRKELNGTNEWRPSPVLNHLG